MHNFTSDDLRMMEQVIVRSVRKSTFPFSIRPLLAIFLFFSEWVPSWLPLGALAVSLGTLGHLLVSLRSSWGTCGILVRRLLESVKTGCPKNKPGIPAPVRKDRIPPFFRSIRGIPGSALGVRSGCSDRTSTRTAGQNHDKPWSGLS